MSKNLSLTDHTALSFLTDGNPAYTWQIARACGLVAGRRCLPQARNMLRRLMRWGFVALGSTPAGHYASWTITDDGRKAINP